MKQLYTVAQSRDTLITDDVKPTIKQRHAVHVGFRFVAKQNILPYLFNFGLIPTKKTNTHIVCFLPQRTKLLRV